MAKIIFKLQSVPEDEAEDIRNLLTENNMEFYETPPGNWGISMHALWLTDDTQYAEARELIEEYQRLRSERIRRETRQKIASGEYETFLQRLVNRPVQLLITLAVILFILYLSTVPFLDFAG